MMAEKKQRDYKTRKMLLAEVAHLQMTNTDLVKDASTMNKKYSDLKADTAILKNSSEKAAKKATKDISDANDTIKELKSAITDKNKTIKHNKTAANKKYQDMLEQKNNSILNLDKDLSNVDAKNSDLKFDLEDARNEIKSQEEIIEVRTFALKKLRSCVASFKSLNRIQRILTFWGKKSAHSYFVEK